MAQMQMQPYPTPLGLFSAFFARQPEPLVLKEKVMSLSGDSFSVKTTDGRPILQVKGEAFSLSGRKHVMDMQGTVLFDIRKKHLAFPALYYGEDPAGNHIFEVKSKWTIGSSKAVCSFISTNGKAEKLLMKGNFFDTTANITDEATGQLVATIDRKFFNARELIGGQQTYVVTVAPNVDMALVIAMCICLDEKRNES
ncbi:tubby C-terminal-like domain-containing protein [Mycena vulgaris]|nr:tubby C-terminal-like domain-containing protein [Mycena vulgaris]